LNQPNDTEAIVAANLRMARALSREEWRAVNTAANQLFKAVRKGREIPLAFQCETFEEAARYRLAHLAAGILLDMTEHAVLTDDHTHIEEFVEALGADGRVPESMLNAVLPALGTLFEAFAPAFADVLSAAEDASAAVGDLAEAARDA
jgi:hypothetical protein